MGWVVEFDDEFARWFETQDVALQDELYARLKLLAQFGPSLRRPHVGTLQGAEYRHLKKMIVQYKGDPWRILFAFDPRRHAILLVGGNERSNNRWYKKSIPIAELRYKKHLEEIEREK